MSRTNKSSAFTLVELLVVITIIGILAGLISVAAVNAVNSAKNAKQKMEIAQLDGAIKSFKSQFGAYPPANLTDVANNTALRSFVAKAFPRYNTATLDADLKAAGVNTAVGGFDPGRALVFWLSRLSNDVTRPFSPVGERQIFYDFDRTRLKSGEPFVDQPSVDANGATVYNGEWDSGESFTDTNGNGVHDKHPQYYIAPGDNEAPIVYFDYRSYGAGGNGTTIPSSPYTFTYNATVGPAIPYLNRMLPDPVAPTPANTVVSTDEWANKDSFQLICAGQDGVFTSAAMTTLRIFPKGHNYSPFDDDNVTNFNDKATLGDAK